MSRGVTSFIARSFNADTAKGKKGKKEWNKAKIKFDLQKEKYAFPVFTELSGRCWCCSAVIENRKKHWSLPCQDAWRLIWFSAVTESQEGILNNWCNRLEISACVFSWAPNNSEFFESRRISHEPVADRGWIRAVLRRGLLEV